MCLVRERNVAPRGQVEDLGAVDVTQVGAREILGELPGEGVLVGGVNFPPLTGHLSSHS